MIAPLPFSSFQRRCPVDFTSRAPRCPTPPRRRRRAAGPSRAGGVLYLRRLSTNGPTGTKGAALRGMSGNNVHVLKEHSPPKKGFRHLLQSKVSSLASTGENVGHVSRCQRNRAIKVLSLSLFPPLLISEIPNFGSSERRGQPPSPLTPIPLPQLQEVSPHSPCPHLCNLTRPKLSPHWSDWELIYKCYLR